MAGVQHSKYNDHFDLFLIIISCVCVLLKHVLLVFTSLARLFQRKHLFYLFT